MDPRDRILDAGLSLFRERSLEAVLRRIVGVGMEVTGARYGALGVLGADGRHLARFIAVGLTPAEEAAIGDPPIGRGLLGVLIEHQEPVRVAPIARHPRSSGFPANHPPMTTMLGAPIRSAAGVLGDLYLTDKEGGEPFSDADEAAVVALARHAAVAIENASLYEAAEGRARLLDAFREIAVAILGGAAVDATLEVIAERAKALVDADEATVALGEIAEAPAAGTMRVPLRSDGVDIGVLTARRRDGAAPFTDEDATVLASFADQAAIALAHARARAVAERAALLEDRERIARDLHDGVIQALFAVGMGLQGAAMLSSDPALAERIEGAATEIDRAIRDLRNYIFGLRPGALADRQLDEALRGIGKEFEQRTGVVTVVDVDPYVASELSSAAADLVHLTREALSNVGRHAEAATCRVSLRREGDGAVLEIDDDGKGFDPTAGGAGMGLPNLRDRARALGGELTLDAAPGRGTLVRVAIPL